jgi:hypothetical protein
VATSRRWTSSGRIDGLDVPADEKIALFRAWLNWRTPASVVDGRSSDGADGGPLRWFAAADHAPAGTASEDETS